jgi:hypothetical protein
MIRRIVPGIAVLGLVAGLSGTLAGHLRDRYSQTSEFGFSGVYDRYLVRFAKIANDVFGNRSASAPARVRQAPAFEE